MKKLSKRDRRTKRSVLFLDVTREERAAISLLGEQRGLTIRELVVSSVLGSEPSNTTMRINSLEARVLLLEATLAEPK